MDYRIQTLDQLKPLLQSFRKLAGLTQAAMAEKLGISQQGYAQIESNLATTSFERLYTILRLLNIDLRLTAEDPPAIAAETGAGVQRRAVATRSPVKGADQDALSADPPRSRSSARSQVKNKEIAAPLNAKRLATSTGKRAPVAKAAPKKLSKKSDTSKW
jgi:HTH-type transcriptional regulator/antitoxin HipB